jgi:hypothetical protein
MVDRPIYYILVPLHHVMIGHLVDRLCNQIRTVSIHFGFSCVSYAASFVECDQRLLFQVELLAWAMLTFRGDLGLEVRSSYAFIYGSTVLSLNLGRIFSFSIYTQSVRLLPCTWDQPVARPLPTHTTT